MQTNQIIYSVQNIEFKVIYSRRRTLGISILPDSSVVVRVPFRTSEKTICRIVTKKASWIIKHRDNYRIFEKSKLTRVYAEGGFHLFRGIESALSIEQTLKPFVRFFDGKIELGVRKPSDERDVRNLLYKGYKNEAMVLFPMILNGMLKKHEDQMFKPASLVIRTMKRRWGSCSNKGIITLSTELVKLPDKYIEYVVIHELCHLKHHNHGTGYYKLLSELFPEWRSVRKELRGFLF